MTTEIGRLDASALALAIRSRKISPVEAVEAAIAAIQQFNPGLLAFCTLTLNQARADAGAMERRLAAGDEVGPLAGIPLGIKDLILTAFRRSWCRQGSGPQRLRLSYPGCVGTAASRDADPK
jgi:Asp-tRNA(Asn)/Glu-tRNA(Gln) amidotransferase A subunit family amidase